jgi:ankyrin repeat protein
MRVDMDMRDEKNSTNLHYACTKGLHDHVKALLNLGANPNVVDTAVSISLSFFILCCSNFSSFLPTFSYRDTQPSTWQLSTIAYHACRPWPNAERCQLWTHLIRRETLHYSLPLRMALSAL